MPLTPLDLARAREMVEALFAQLELDAYLFAIERTARGWELRLECATVDGWQTETVLLGEQLPGPDPADAAMRDKLLACLKEKVSACKRRV